MLFFQWVVVGLVASKFFTDVYELIEKEKAPITGVADFTEFVLILVLNLIRAFILYLAGAFSLIA